MRTAVLTAALAAVLHAPVAAAPAQAPATPPASSLRVYLMTMGQGDATWEKFGHNAIWLVDESVSLDVAYNYGMFSFDEPGWLGRFLRGEMMYWVEGFHGTRLAQFYAGEDRSVWVQELELTDAQKAELRSFLEWNDRPENRFYRYDYYRDNCSTRVRDAIDRVLGGVLRNALEGQPTGTTYRSHSLRLTADVLPVYTGLMLGLGPYTDRPIDAWEESFLPVRLMEHVRTVGVIGEDGAQRPLVRSESQLFTAGRPPERDAAPRRTPAYALAGLALGALLWRLGRAPAGRRAGAFAFFSLALAWSLVAGAFGAIIASVWAFTDHAAGYANENVLQVNVLSLVLLVLLVAAAFGRARRAAWLLAAAITAVSLLGFALQALPAFDQANGPIIALALPAHAGLALALRARSRRT